MVTARWLQRDQTFPLSVKGVALGTHPTPIHQRLGQHNPNMLSLVPIGYLYNYEYNVCVCVHSCIKIWNVYKLLPKYYNQSITENNLLYQTRPKVWVWY